MSSQSNENRCKLMVLLGAGASAEAGIPMAVGMTQKIIKWFDEPGPSPEYAPILHFVEARLRHRETSRGKDLTQGINIEELFGAIELLANRHDLTIGPFVNQWHPFLEGHKARPAFFAGLKHSIVTTMTEFVWCDSETKVEYLKPLVLQGKDQVFTIATLNYDNTIELACDTAGIPFDVGLEQWNQSGVFQKPQQGIELLKLHGSVDWSMVPDPSAPGVPLTDATVQRVPLGNRRSYPVIIFGGGNKLTVDGPFLDLLKAFQRRLEKHTTLVVIGYSFGDLHVNRLIERWLRRSKKRRIIIIDRPKDGDNVLLPPLIRDNQIVFEGRFDFCPVGAKSGIAKLFEVDSLLQKSLC